MANIHLVMQGKGGVGKSLTALLLAQYKTQQQSLPLCIDIDPVNATFHAFKALEVKFLNLIEENHISTTYFDHLIQLLGEHQDEVVIDSGASAFLPLLNYLVSHDIASLLQELGHNLIVHTVITGGQSGLDTINSFAKLATHFDHFVIWLNPFLGELSYEGKSFEQLKVYQQYCSKVLGMITLPNWQRETFGHDLQQMLQQSLTFAEALADSSRLIIVRHRLKRMRDQIFDQLALLRI